MRKTAELLRVFPNFADLLSKSKNAIFKLEICCSIQLSYGTVAREFNPKVPKRHPNPK
jgi:hypothetical protein